MRAPKVYVADAGILHALLGVETLHQLHGHPKVGASWEGFVISQLFSRFELQRNEVYFWATHGGAEIDLMVMRRGRRTGFEFKRTTSPAVTRSMSIASADLRLDRLYVVHAGTGSFQLAEGVEAIDLASLDRVELE